MLHLKPDKSMLLK